MDSHRESTEKKQGDVVLSIAGEEQPRTKDPKVETFEEPTNHKPQSPTPEIVLKSSTSPRKLPRHPQSDTLVHRKLIPTSAFLKPKSRFAEPTALTVPIPVLDSASSTYICLPNPKALGSPKISKNDDEEEEDEEEEVYKREQSSDGPVRRKKLGVRNLVEWLILVLAISCWVASLLIPELEGHEILGLEIWRWCYMIAVVCCGRLLTNWLITVVIFLIERNFLLKQKVLYYVYALKKSVQICLWLVLVLLSWLFVFNKGISRSQKTEKVRFFSSRLLVSLLLGSLIWLVKTLLVKILASSFHMNRFFDRIQESIFHQYVLQTLSGPPVMEIAEKVGARTISGKLSFRSRSKGKGKGEKQEVIDVSKLYKMQQEKVSAWTMKGLVNVIRTSGLSTLSNTIDESFDEKEQREITSELEAKAAAYQIFKNVAKSGSKYIEAEDLLRFLSKEELEYVLPLFEGAAESAKIRQSALRNWVVRSYLDRKSLAHSLNDTKTAVNQLHKVATVIVILAVLIIALILTGIATTQVLVFISSQLLLVVFMFGNTCKMAFEAIIFVFVMHPFDVGDRCVVDGIQMVVEEMNILTTVFLKFDNEKIYYPNSVLATKPISNFYRSPHMSDSVEFSVGISTSVDKLGALKSKIKMYIDSKRNHWHPNHSVEVKGIVDVGQISMVLHVSHTMNFQNVVEKNSRRTDLVLELKKIFEELSIRYNLLPQEVQLSFPGLAP